VKGHVSPVLAVGCVAALMAGGAAAQTFRSAVNLIVLQVTVTDSDGRFVTGLSRDDFSVYEDDAERPIEQFSAERVPVSLGILVDISGSMEGRRFADAREALGKLLERFHEDDQIFLGAFNNTFKLLVPWTSDHAALLRSLSGVTPHGGTFLYSSISAALPVLNHGPNRKKALVVISDGDDNEKMAGLNRGLLTRAVQQGQQSEALIYVIGIGVPKPPFEKFYSLDRESRLRFFYDPPVDVDLLRRLTDPTGGYTQVASSTADLPSTVISIADDLSAQYMIGFESAAPDGGFHTLTVTTRNPRDRVRAKTGYASP
jgi:Ca-activated chloride channel family protein